MNYPWNIYPNLWQNSDVLTTQSLSYINNFQQHNGAFNYKNTPMGQYWGIHSVQINLNNLSQGLITVENVQCTFPNGYNFVYNNQWKQYS